MIPHVLAEMDCIGFGDAQPQYGALVTAEQRGRLPLSAYLMAVPFVAKGVPTCGFQFAYLMCADRVDYFCR